MGSILNLVVPSSPTGDRAGDMGTQEHGLNYVQFKVANEARLAEEARVDTLRRNILVLILEHLQVTARSWFFPPFSLSFSHNISYPLFLRHTVKYNLIHFLSPFLLLVLVLSILFLVLSPFLFISLFFILLSHD